MPELKYIAGEDIKAGLYVVIASDTGLIVTCQPEQSSQAMFVIDRDVKQGESITYEISKFSDLEHPRLVPSLLHEKHWAVISDEGVTTDLTYQEAQQLEMAFIRQGIKGVALVTNAAGKRALEHGYVRTAADN